MAIITIIKEVKKFHQQELAKLKVIDFLINLSYDKQIIPNKRYLKLGYTLDNITKYMTGWKKNINN